MGFYVIGDEDTVRGFRFAGVDGTVAQNGEEAREALADALERHDESIIIITEKLAASVRERIQEIRFGEALPLIVEVPGPEGPQAETPDLLERIREAVGLKF